MRNSYRAGAIIALWTVFGCAPSNSTKPVGISLTGLYSKSEMRVLFNGHEINRFSQQLESRPTSAFVEFKSPEDGTVSVLLSTPDGWEEIVETQQKKKSRQADPDSYEEKQWVIEAECKMWRPNLHLFVDNRGGETPVDVECGQWKGRVPSNEKGILELSGPAKEESSIIKLDGRRIGTLWDSQASTLNPPKQDALIRGSFLIDVSGKRRYRWERVAYGFVGQGFDSDVHVFDSAFVHRLPRAVDDFLEEPPSTQLGYGGVSTRIVLRGVYVDK